jgi:hypothetical protein
MVEWETEWLTCTVIPSAIVTSDLTWLKISTFWKMGVPLSVTHWFINIFLALGLGWLSWDCWRYFNWSGFSWGIFCSWELLVGNKLFAPGISASNYVSPRFVILSKGGSCVHSHCALCVSLQLGAIEAQWFRLRPEMEDRGSSPTLTGVGCHWGPVISTSARIGSPGPGRFPYSHWGWVPLRPSDFDFGQKWRTREVPPTITGVGCHRGLVISTSARNGSPGPGRFPISLFEWSQGVF